MSRVAELPGYGPIRSATLISYLDTPWRFKSKAALWKYVGIGLHRQKSGEDLNIIGVEQACNRLLRNVTIGAARSAIEQKRSVFAQRYAHWIHSGLSPGNARRNVARDQVTAIWGMWKSDRAFDASLIRQARLKTGAAERGESAGAANHGSSVAVPERCLPPLRERPDL